MKVAMKNVVPTITARRSDSKEALMVARILLCQFEVAKELAPRTEMSMVWDEAIELVKAQIKEIEGK